MSPDDVTVADVACAAEARPNHAAAVHFLGFQPLFLGEILVAISQLLIDAYKDPPPDRVAGIFPGFDLAILVLVKLSEGDAEGRPAFAGGFNSIDRIPQNEWRSGGSGRYTMRPPQPLASLRLISCQFVGPRNHDLGFFAGANVEGRCRI